MTWQCKGCGVVYREKPLDPKEGKTCCDCLLWIPDKGFKREMAGFGRWRLSPATKRTALPVNGKRNEG